MKKSVSVYRVSDLLRRSFTESYLAEEFVRINQEAWPHPFPKKYLWSVDRVLNHFKTCPDLQYCALVEGEVAGTLSTFHTTSDAIERCRSWEEATSNGFFSGHRYDGDVAFGADLSVGCRFQYQGVSTELILAGLIYTAVVWNKRGIYLGSRIPHFHKRAASCLVDEYVFGKDGKTRDPEIRIYQKSGFEIKRIVPGYMEDPESRDYGVLMFWQNPFVDTVFTEERHDISQLGQLAQRLGFR